MKALTLHQPWASLVAHGTKTIETRSWSTKYRGPLAIHAGMKRPPGFWSHWGEPESAADPLLARMSDSYEFDHLFDSYESLDGEGYWYHKWRGPLGAIVATCRLANVAPMVREIPPQPEWVEPWSCMTLDPWPIMNVWPGFGSAHGFRMSDQLPYGDFAPGRFAWVLADVEPCEPIPAKGKQGLWNWEVTP